MTIVLHLDTEQAALIEAALEFGVAALDARAKRIDPGKIVSQSHELQSIKLKQVQEQMALPPLPVFSQMKNRERATIERAIEGWPTLQHDREKDALLKHILAVCEDARCSQKAHRPPGQKAEIDI